MMSCPPRHAALCLAAAAILAGGCSRPADTPAAPPTAQVAQAGGPTAAAAPARSAAPADAAASGIAWRHASSDADVDAAFAQARAADRPVFVYWGAKWCPPCNQVKATLFNRQEFIERSRAFVPVYVDGDSPGAQRLGARFHVSGYPTMVLFSPQGTELTRLPGEVEPTRYTEVLTLGMNAQRPVRDVLAKALAGGAGLAPNDWRLLGFYAWDVDQQQLVPAGGTPQLLTKLAATCPPELRDVAQRLQLQALAAAEPARGAAVGPAARDALRRLLADPAAARAQTDVLVNAAPAIVRAAGAGGTPERADLLGAFDTALGRLQHDATLSRADRLAALSARVELARIDVPEPAPGRAAPTLPAALLADVRDTAARDDREITDGNERQAVVTAAADTLARAGLADDATALLTSNLARSHSPYYLMSMLSHQAKERGDTARALDWSARAFAASEGPATRLQWGASHVATLVELAPQDDAQIETTAAQLFTEAAAEGDAFYGRSGRALRKMGTSLQRWHAGGRHAEAFARLQQRLDALCGALPAADPNRTACGGLLRPSQKPPAPRA